MSRQFLLDGYNLLRQMPALSPLTLEAGRRGLVRFVAERRPQGGAGNEAVIVFDGREDVPDTPSSSSGIRVLFSKGETADDLIKRLVEDAARPEDITLVTDDRELGFYCRTHGARWSCVAPFLAKAASAGSATRAAAGSKVIPGALESRVNKELKELWLKGP